MLDELNDHTVGIAPDSYALWWDPNLKPEIERAGKRIINFHVAGWLSVKSYVWLDRGIPGDGHINNRKIRGWLEQRIYGASGSANIFRA